MYVIIVYDVNVERVAKIYHYLLKYLNWVQNSGGRTYRLTTNKA
ncbi:MAG: CRISPR-associated endonuclease Cas2 [Canidatus Methanoxibalbensis ujae]|nr:CRISPR-associated endonuclease Cas2 [Candidatus Methanoxibalbensis ujae]